MVHSCFAHDLRRRFAHLAVVTLVQRIFNEALTWLIKAVLNAAQDPIVVPVGIRGSTLVGKVPIHSGIAVGTDSASSNSICMNFLLIGD